MDGSNWGNNPKVTIAYCCCSGAKMHLTLLRPMVCNPPGSSVQGISQARILEWVAVSFSWGSPDPEIKPVFPALQADSLPLSQ